MPKRFLQRRDKQSGADAVESSDLADLITEDPVTAFMVFGAAVQEAHESGDRIALGRALVHQAEIANYAIQQGVDLVGPAATLLDQAIDVFKEGLPETRVDLANAHYTRADMARGRDRAVALRHYEDALPLVHRDDGMLWVAITEGLAASLIRGPEGDDPAVQERSIALYYDALSVEPPIVPPDHWLLTVHGLTLTLLERHRGSVLENWGAVLEITNRAMPLAVDITDDGLAIRIFSMNSRARIAYNVVALMTDVVPAEISDAEVLAQLESGAEGLAMGSPPTGSPVPLVARLAAQAEGRRGANGLMSLGFLQASLALLEAIDDRRGRIVAHLLLATHGDAAAHRDSHFEAVTTLISPHDEEVAALRHMGREDLLRP